VAGLGNTEILALARKIGYEADPTAPSTERYMRWAIGIKAGEAGESR